MARRLNAILFRLRRAVRGASCPSAFPTIAQCIAPPSAGCAQGLFARLWLRRLYRLSRLRSLRERAFTRQ